VQGPEIADTVEGPSPARRAIVGLVLGAALGVAAVVAGVERRPGDREAT
jgi:uncharacterized protein involved in exopolysaccharide biosynthesis